MSARKGKLNIDDSIKKKNNIHIINKTKFNQKPKIYIKNNNSKNKTYINSERNKRKIEFNKIYTKYNKYFYQKSFEKEQKSSMGNLRKINYNKNSNSKNNNKSKKSSSNKRLKSTQKNNSSKNMSKNKSKSKSNKKYLKLNDSIEIIKNKKNNRKIRKRNEYNKSPTQKMISYNPSSITKTPKVNKNFSKIKYKETNFTCKGLDDYSMKRNRSKNNNDSSKKEVYIFLKKESNSSEYSSKSISKKTIVRNKKNNNNIILNKPSFRCTSSYDIDNKGINNNNNNKKKDIYAHYKKIEEIGNFNSITKRNILKTIYINLNNESSTFSKKLILQTENNTNSNINYNTGNNSNNNTLKKILKNENKSVFNNTTSKMKENGRPLFSQNTNKYKEAINEIERKKLSFDVIGNNFKKKLSEEFLKKVITNSNIQTNQNSLIIKLENKRIKNYFQEKKDEKEDSVDSDDNALQLITENEQGGTTGINSVKTNNFIINKPKEENLKYSSIKEFLDDNEDQTEINPSQISKIIIGQIEGYKDIIDEDKNLNINDKSKSILELLSKYSFSFIKNRQSIENVDNLNLFEESNDIRDIKNYTSMANSRNIIGESNLPNLTNIKKVEEDNDSEDLSISVFENNIKSINTHSNVYLDKIFYDKSNNKIKTKNNNSNNKYCKNSINTNNTTISSGNNNKDHNLKTKLNEKNQTNNDKMFVKYNSDKKMSPSSSIKYGLHYYKKAKNTKSKDKKKNNKNESK